MRPIPADRPRRTLAALGVALVLVACGAPSGSPSGSPAASGSGGALRPVTLLLSYQPDVQFAPFYVAQREGYYADEGLEVSIEHKSGADLIRLVADGQAEVGVADATDVMISRTADIPVRYVSTLYRRFPVALIGPAGEVPTDPAGLAGKRIGTPGKFGSSWHALLALLDAGGLTADDVTIREYPQFNQVEGLLNGDVDLITGFRVNEPLRLEAAGMQVDLLTLDEIAPLPGPGLIAGDDVLADDPQLVAAFARATARAQRAVIDDPELGLRDALAEVPTIREDQQTARKVLEASAALWAGDGFQDGAIDMAVWRAGYDTMRRLGLIDGSVSVDEMVAPYAQLGPAARAPSQPAVSAGSGSPG